MIVFSIFLTMFVSVGCSDKQSESIAENTETVSKQEENPYEIQTSNSLGNYLARQMKQQEAPDNDSNFHEENRDERFTITDLLFESESGKVSVKTSQTSSCTLSIVIFQTKYKKW